MKNLRNITKYVDVKKFKPRPLDTAQQALLITKLQYFVKGTNRLSHTFKFPRQQYQIVLERMNQIGRIADEMDHHPEWTLSTDNLQVNLNTHEIQGISEKDYLLAYVFQELMKDLPQEAKILQGWNK